MKNKVKNKASKQLSQKIAKVISIILLFSSMTHASTANDLTIDIESNNFWQDKIFAFRLLCENTTKHFQDVLDEENKLSNTNIHVKHDNSGPFVKADSNADYTIFLSVNDLYGSQIVYQFSHELMHIITDYQTISAGSENLWFHESLCMLASVWVIEQMSQTWKDNPPHAEWASYAPKHEKYAKNMLSDPNKKYEGSVADWISENEEFLRIDSLSGFSQHILVCQLSYRFLPIFEKFPEAWNAVAQMPKSNSKIKDYLREWFDKVDSENKKYVAAIAKLMEIDVDLTKQIDADINKDGYVDLSDVMIVRSGIKHKNSYDTDINKDGITDEKDLEIVKNKAMEAIIQAAPSLIRRKRITTWGKLKQQRK